LNLEAIPGVDKVGWTSRLPLSPGIGSGSRFRLPGALESETVGSTITTVSDGFFSAAGIDVIAGRGLDEDMAEDEIVVNTTLADTLFGSPGAAVGAVLEEMGRQDGEVTWTRLRIRGVVATVRPRGPRNGVRAAHYVPPERWPTRELGFALRVRGNPTPYREAVEAAALGVNPRVVPYDVRTLRQAADGMVTTDRTLARVVTGFSLAGLVLAALGLYGVIGRYVASRRRELGVRMAVGARPSGLVWALVRSGVILGLVAAAIGVPIAMLSIPVLEARLFGGATGETGLLLAAASVVVTVSALAAWIPARRVTRISPRDALL
jgi:ABC-type antimicrobial peptide transport system permease subunit